MKYKTTNMLVISTMILCFRLVVLFLDGTFSYHRIASQETVVPVPLQEPAKLSDHVLPPAI